MENMEHMEEAGILQINSEKFFSLRIPVSEVIGWLQAILDVSDGNGDLDMALRACRSYVLSSACSRAVIMVSELIAMEASGKIIPPINIYEVYRELVARRG